jgi:hypothetical protein
MPLYQLFCLRNVCQYSSSYKGLLDASKNETKKLEFVIKPENFSLIDNSYNRVNEPGKILISTGGRQSDSKSLSDKSVLQSEIEITGNTFKIEE